MAKAGKGPAKGGKKGGSAARENLVVGSKVRDYIKTQGKQSSGDLVDAVSNKVHEILDAAIARAHSNGERKTIRPHDL